MRQVEPAIAPIATTLLCYHEAGAEPPFTCPFSVQCWAGNDIAVYTPEFKRPGSCTMACYEDGSQKCGDFCAGNLYALTGWRASMTKSLS
jgi:hypothetical protein